MGALKLPTITKDTGTLKTTYNEKQIVNLMQSLDISRADAIEILQSDAEIDKGAKLFELTPEQKAVEKKMRKTVKAVAPNGKKIQRELKIDDNREKLLKSIIELFNEKFSIENIERPPRTTNKIRFDFMGDTFNVIIAKERKKKGE